MKFGVRTPILRLSPGKHADWEANGTIDDVGRIAEAADKLGFEYLTCSEHVAVPLDRDAGFGHGHRPGGRYWDSLATFGYLAALTSRIRFTTLVLVLSYHHPLDVAKRYGTLDRISGGRLNLGVGIGYLRPEFELLGIPFEGRVARFEDAVRAVRVSFGHECPEYIGTHYRFSGLVIDPCGLQTDVPIWIGGQSRQSLRRAVQLGDAWSAYSVSPSDLSRWLAEEADTEVWERRSKPLDIVLSTIVDPEGAPRQTAEHVEQLREAGATTLSLQFITRSLLHYLEQLEAMRAIAPESRANA